MGGVHWEQLLGEGYGEGAMERGSVGGFTETRDSARLWLPSRGGCTVTPCLGSPSQAPSFPSQASSLPSAKLSQHPVEDEDPLAPSGGSPLTPCLDSPSKAFLALPSHLGMRP